MRKSALPRVFLSLYLGAAAAAAESGAAEVGGHVGVKWLDGTGTKFAAGGSSYFALNRRIWVGGELTYTPLANLDLNTNTYSVSVHARLLDFAGNIQVNLATGGKVVPYLVGGLAGGRFSMSGFEEDFTATRLAVEAGIGLRYYAGEKWGIRPEFKFIKYKEGVSSVRFAVGLFCQFGK
jgi:opacity protein-like surface antigen